MNPLSFRCPKTEREVITGIGIDFPALRHVQPVTVRLLCPFCNRPHAWKLADGLLGEPDEPQAPAASATDFARRA